MEVDEDKNVIKKPRLGLLISGWKPQPKVVRFHTFLDTDVC